MNFLSVLHTPTKIILKTIVKRNRLHVSTMAKICLVSNVHKGIDSSLNYAMENSAVP